jgi:hypothetical protein
VARWERQTIGCRYPPGCEPCSGRVGPGALPGERGALHGVSGAGSRARGPSDQAVRRFGPRGAPPGTTALHDSALLLVDAHIPPHLAALPAHLAWAAGTTDPSTPLEESPTSELPSLEEARASTSASSSSSSNRLAATERWLAESVEKAVHPCLLLSRIPKSVVQVAIAFVQTPDLASLSPSEWNLHLLPAAVMAASVALADAGIEATGLVGAATFQDSSSSIHTCVAVTGRDSCLTVHSGETDDASGAVGRARAGAVAALATVRKAVKATAVSALERESLHVSDSTN